jgi:hypothetical protein
MKAKDLVPGHVYQSPRSRYGSRPEIYLFHGIEVPPKSSSWGGYSHGGVKMARVTQVLADRLSQSSPLVGLTRLAVEFAPSLEEAQTILKVEDAERAKHDNARKAKDAMGRALAVKLVEAGIQSARWNGSQMELSLSDASAMWQKL